MFDCEFVDGADPVRFSECQESSLGAQLAVEKNCLGHPDQDIRVKQ